MEFRRVLFRSRLRPQHAQHGAGLGELGLDQLLAAEDGDAGQERVAVEVDGGRVGDHRLVELHRCDAEDVAGVVGRTAEHQVDALGGSREGGADRSPEELALDRAGGVHGGGAEGTDSLGDVVAVTGVRSGEHTSEIQSLMRISYAVFCLKTKKSIRRNNNYNHILS